MDKLPVSVHRPEVSAGAKGSRIRKAVHEGPFPFHIQVRLRSKYVATHYCTIWGSAIRIRVIQSTQSIDHVLADFASRLMRILISIISSTATIALMLAGGLAIAKQPTASLSEIVTAADVVFLGRAGSEPSTTTSSPNSVSWIKPRMKVLRSIKGKLKAESAIVLCYKDDGGDPPSLVKDHTYLVFARRSGNGCYEPVNGMRGVASVISAHVDTRYLEGEPDTQPLDELLRRIGQQMKEKANRK